MYHIYIVDMMNCCGLLLGFIKQRGINRLPCNLRWIAKDQVARSLNSAKITNSQALGYS